MNLQGLVEEMHAGGAADAVRPLQASEITPALMLAWSVFLKCEAPQYPQEGVRTFYRYLKEQMAAPTMAYYGAFRARALVGMLALREETHISLFFVREDCQGQGIGRRLFACRAGETPCEDFTVHAAPTAVPFYERLGFRKTAEEQCEDGIRFTPMLYLFERKVK